MKFTEGPGGGIMKAKFKFTGRYTKMGSMTMHEILIRDKIRPDLEWTGLMHLTGHPRRVRK